MENTQNYLQVLSESLDKKLVILADLEQLTDEQLKIVGRSEFEEDDFSLNLEKKAGLIAEIERLDRGFQLLYGNIRRQLDEGKEQYRPQIAELQQKIRMVMDRTVSIQVKEKHNKEEIEARFARMKKEIRAFKKGRQTAANYYKSMNSITTEPYFLDKKN